MQTIKQETFCGRTFTSEEILLIQEITGSCGGISRRELALTVCELLEWKRPNKRLKAKECTDFLELLESKGVQNLPDKKRKGQANSQKIIPESSCKQPFSTLSGSVEEFAPLEVQRVQTRGQRDQFKRLIGRYHYLRYAIPFGARIQYLISVTRPHRELGGLCSIFQPCLAHARS